MQRYGNCVHFFMVITNIQKEISPLTTSFLNSLPHARYRVSVLHAGSLSLKKGNFYISLQFSHVFNNSTYIIHSLILPSFLDRHSNTMKSSIPHEPHGPKVATAFSNYYATLHAVQLLVQDP